MMFLAVEYEILSLILALLMEKFFSSIYFTKFTLLYI